MVESLCGMQIYNFTPNYLEPFLYFFFVKYVQQTFIDHKKDEVMALDQGGITVVYYKVQFYAFSRYTMQLV